MEYSPGGRMMEEDPGPPPLDGDDGPVRPAGGQSPPEDVAATRLSEDEEARILFAKAARGLICFVGDVFGLGLTPEEVKQGTVAVVNFGEAWFPDLKLGPRLESALVLGLWGAGIVMRRRRTRRGPGSPGPRPPAGKGVPPGVAAPPPSSSPPPPPGQSVPGGTVDVGEVEE